jgi:hypothetical protein
MSGLHYDLAAEVRLYARWIRDECLGEGDETPPLITLALKADLFTAPHLAALLLIENDRLADPPFRLDGEQADAQLKRRAQEIGYQAS